MTSRTVLAVALAAIFVVGCGPEQRKVGLDVDVFLNPSSADLTDVLLQTGIAKRLADDTETKAAIIHVRVLNGVVILSGAVRSPDVKTKAEKIAKDTVVKVNEASIQTRMDVANRI